MRVNPFGIDVPADIRRRAPQGRAVRHASPRILAAWRSVWVTSLTLLILLQLVLFPDFTNLGMSFLLFLGNFFGYGYALRQTFLKRYPVSTLMILGYTASYFSVPAIGKILEAESVTHNLDYPLHGASYALLGLFAIVLGHIIYRRSATLCAARKTMQTHFYQRIGFFREPRVSQLWLLGILGALGLLLSRPHSVQEGGAFGAFMVGFRPFVYVPYLMLLLSAWSQRRSVSRFHTSLLWPYSIVLLLLSFIANSRAYLLVGFVSIGILYLYMVLVGRIPVPRIRLGSLILVLIAIVLVLGPISRLSMSMILVRADRDDLAPMQLAVATWSTFRQDDVTERYETLWNLYNENAKEDYFDSAFLNRLGNLRFVDLAVTNSQGLGAGGMNRFAETEGYKVASILPAPLLRLVAPDVDKHWYTSGSSGDFLLYEATGNADVIGTYRTGSLLVNLRLTFGLLWPLVMSILTAVLFAISDALCKPERRAAAGDSWIRFNVLVAGSLFTYTFALTSAATGIEGLAGLIEPVLRGWIQIGVLYAVAFHASRLLTLAPRRQFRIRHRPRRTR